MPDDSSTKQLDLVTEIVAAYVRRNQVAADQLPSLISAVHHALDGLGQPMEEALVERTPAVPVRQSVRRDYVVCLECGHRGQLLRRHLGTAHGLSVEQYRTIWNLPADHPVTAPAYSEARSIMAKDLGLGRGGKSADITTIREAVVEVTPQPTPKRRGRPRSKVTSTVPA